MHMKLLGSKEASILTLSSVHHFSSNSRQCYGTHVTLTRVARNNDEHSLSPRPKPTPAQIAFSIACVILEAIYAPDEVW